MRILLIEDDQLIGDGIAVGLGKLGFAMDWFQNGLDGREALGLAPYDAVILDLSLPGIDGLDILAHWRQKGHKTPILILTARGSLNQRVEGLEAGADDYLPKPFALEEVAARLKAIMRRGLGQCEKILTHGAVCLDESSRRVTLAGVEVSLSAKEIMLLELFLFNKTRVLSKEFIDEKLYNWDEEIQSNTVEVHVHNLRRKLGANFIRTIRKAGYLLGDEEEL